MQVAVSRVEHYEHCAATDDGSLEQKNNSSNNDNIIKNVARLILNAIKIYRRIALNIHFFTRSA
jgi:hypothetical protein